MNAVTLKIELSRVDSVSCRVRIIREGCGDDILETRADFIQMLIRQSLEEMYEIEQMAAASKKL